MPAAIDQFAENLKRARELVALAERLTTLTTNAVDLSDILRAALVLAVSALDHFVHEFVRLGMLDVYRGMRPQSAAFLSFRIALADARSGFADPAKDDWLDQAVRASHSWQSFQHPDKIADAIRLVSVTSLWDAVALDLGAQSKTVKAQLSAIVDRRNKIAHEADIDATNPGSRWPINAKMVTDAIATVERIVQSIDKVA